MSKLISLLLILVASSALNPRFSHLSIDQQFKAAIFQADVATMTEILGNKTHNIDVNAPVYGITYLTTAALESLKRTHAFMDLFYSNPYVNVIRTLISHGADPCTLSEYDIILWGIHHTHTTSLEIYLTFAYSPHKAITLLLQCQHPRSIPAL